MDIFSILSYLNKISLLAFIVTAGFLGYQFYLLKKESSQTTKKTPMVPDFNENEKFDVLNYTKLQVNQEQPQPSLLKKDSKTIPGIIITCSLLVLTLGVFLIIRTRQTDKVSKIGQNNSSISPTTITKQSLTPTGVKNLALVTTVTPSKMTFTPTPTYIPKSITITPSPTEVVLAKVNPTLTVTSPVVLSKTPTPTTLTSLPLTGVIDKSFILFGIATSLIFFAFVF